MPVRKVTARDIDRIREIDSHAFSEHDQYTASHYEQIVASDDYDLVAVTGLNGAVVGWASVDLGCAPIRIRSLSIDPAFQKRGFGRKILDAILEKHRGEIDLLVERENAAAIRLYRSRGFTDATPDAEMPQRLRMIRGAR